MENIRQKHRLKKRELALKQKEELAAGLHLIDFEQLKIENQTYNEKIEERNEDLLKLKRKIECTVQVLFCKKTHIFSKKLNLLELNFEISQILNFDLNYGYLGFFYLSKIEFLIH